jgi:hypothetical protein
VKEFENLIEELESENNEIGRLKNISFMDRDYSDFVKTDQFRHLLFDAVMRK